MILDPLGRPLRRAIGFTGGYVVVSKARPLVDSLYLVGFEKLQVEEEPEEADAARNRDRTRRAA